jgi:hypothetical protein
LPRTIAFIEFSSFPPPPMYESTQCNNTPRTGASPKWVVLESFPANFAEHGASTHLDT